MRFAQLNIPIFITEVLRYFMTSVIFLLTGKKPVLFFHNPKCLTVLRSLRSDAKGSLP